MHQPRGPEAGSERLERGEEMKANVCHANVHPNDLIMYILLIMRR